MDRMKRLTAMNLLGVLILMSKKKKLPVLQHRFQTLVPSHSKAPELRSRNSGQSQQLLPAWH